MKPPVPDILNRKSVDHPPPHLPTTFFLARDPGDHHEEMFGVQSLPEPRDHDDDIHPDQISSSHHHSHAHLDSNPHYLKPLPSHFVNKTPEILPTRSSRSPDISLSRPLTPLGSAPLDESLPSSPKSTSTRSLKPLDDISITDDLSSQALASGDDGEDHHPSDLLDSSSQLIMPSICMPSRRPFTERGKRVGRFKILVAGATGAGKSSLIKSIVHACEDIVHVDPIPTTSRSSRSGARRTRRSGDIVEIHASTKPYPLWWSDLEDAHVLRRRKSAGDTVLERNLCFVDVSSGTTSRTHQTQAITQYIAQQLLRAIAAGNMGNADFQGLLSGDGGSQVDVVLYLISEDTLDADMEGIGTLSELTNVIPLIAKADRLLSAQITGLKKSFWTRVQKAGIRPFRFGRLPPGVSEDNNDHDADGLPFSVSSAQSNDDDNMDASALMSPDYVPPLVPSELTGLIECIFDQDNLARLRHSAAKKLVQSRTRHLLLSSPASPSPSRPAVRSGRSPRRSHRPSLPLSAAAPPAGALYPVDGASSYTMARLTDYTQREERRAQVRLAKWASDLQRSLQNERERYAVLARGDRAVWLTERLGECVLDGTLVPITRASAGSRLHLTSEKENGAVLIQAGGELNHPDRVMGPLSLNDPLGLIRWSDDLKRRGWVIVQVVGSVGVVGGLALWLVKVWGLPWQAMSDFPLNSYWLRGD